MRSSTRASRRADLARTLALLASIACSTSDPPGRIGGKREGPPLRHPTAIAEASTSAAPEPAATPFNGQKLASIAMRTWIYAEPRERADKLGYLRSGATIERSDEAAGNEGCEGGWYRVRPRGYVCIGKGATLDLNHPIVQAYPRGPNRDDGLPYLYAVSDSPPPHLYFKLPSVADQERVEGKTVRAHAIERMGLFKDLPLDPVPPFLLAGNNLPQPYGSEKNLSFSVHRGKAKENSAFGLASVFEWESRRFGLTTELDLIPLDRTKPARASTLQGIVVQNGGRPGFARQPGTTQYEKKGEQFVPAGHVAGRTGFELTGLEQGGMAETASGVWIPLEALILADVKKDRAGHAEKRRKWISVSIKKQLLVAYEGEKPVYASLVSTGRGGLSDPDETTATIRGTFLIRAKHVSGTMDGDEGSDESFDLRDVPYIQYFHEGYALHAAYWHDDFGKERSHGCVNLAPKDAAWLFGWTDPQVPREWHGAVAPHGGTLVYIHP